MLTEKKEIMMTKKVLYCIPAAAAVLFYGLLGIFGGFGAIDWSAWLMTAMLLLAAVLMISGRRWGCIFGIAVGAWLIYMGMQETGQIVKEWGIGIVFCLYFVLMGLICTKETAKEN